MMIEDRMKIRSEDLVIVLKICSWILKAPAGSRFLVRITSAVPKALCHLMELSARETTVAQSNRNTLTQTWFHT